MENPFGITRVYLFAAADPAGMCMLPPVSSFSNPLKSVWPRRMYHYSFITLFSVLSLPVLIFLSSSWNTELRNNHWYSRPFRSLSLLLSLTLQSHTLLLVCIYQFHTRCYAFALRVYLYLCTYTCVGGYPRGLATTTLFEALLSALSTCKETHAGCVLWLAFCVFFFFCSCFCFFRVLS